MAVVEWWVQDFGVFEFGALVLVFDVGAGSVLWERGVVFFGVASGRSEGTTAGLTGRRNKARDAYETALRLIGVVGVASFTLSSKCCLL